MKKIKLGDWVEALIYTFSLGYGEHIAMWVAKNIFNKNTCGCCERKQWLNRLTNPAYDGQCGGIKLW